MTSGGVDNGVIAFTFESVKHILGTGDMETVMGMTFWRSSRQLQRRIAENSSTLLKQLYILKF